MRYRPMPCFYTHVLNGVGFTPDEEGQEFADLPAALRSALKGAAEMVAEEVMQGRSAIDLELHVHGETGERLATLPVAARVTGLDSLTVPQGA